VWFGFSARPGPAASGLAWRLFFGWRRGPGSADGGFEPRLHRDIGLDPPETWSDGRCGRDFTRYLQYY